MKNDLGQTIEMTALKLDERPPLVVMVGDFNPAIFNPLWVARHLHGYDEGADVPMFEMMIEVPGGLGQLTFIKGVAIAVNANRLEAFVLSQEAARVDALESALTKLTDVLPHTPLRGIGCNLQYVDDDPSADLMGLFDSPEGLEGEYPLRARSMTAQIELADGILNLTRATVGTTVQFSFNYHYVESNADAYANLIPGLVTKCREHSTALLASLYNLHDAEPISFMKIETEETESGQAGG